MEQSDAFELNEASVVRAAHSALLDEDRHALHVKVAVCAVALVVLVVVSMCLTVSVQGILPPSEVLSCVGLWFQIQYSNLFTSDIPLTMIQIMGIEDNYFEVTTRFSISVLTALCGAMLALSGALFQYVFKNPIAAPTMLGVQSGVNVGIVLLVLMFGTSALYRVAERYALCYAGAALVLVLVLAFGRLIGGKGTFNVVNMLLVGSIVSQLFGTVVTYVTNLLMDEATYEVYFEVQEQFNVDASWISWVALLVSAVVCVAPLVAMRFSMNALSFTDDDSRLMGVSPNVLRVVALVCGSLMVTTSMIYCGMVSMASLLVPHIARQLFGAEFGKQLVGNMLIGALLLLVCRDITALIPFLDTGIPLGTVVTFVTMPFFVWMLAIQQRSWE